MPLHAFTARSAATRLIAHVAMVLVMLAAGHGALAQLKVRTETIKPPATTVPPSANQFVPPGRDGGPGRDSGPDTPATERPAAAGQTASAPGPAGPETAADLSRLPPAVLRTRDRILAAAHTGDLQTLMALMRANGNVPVFSHTQKQDPVAYWKETYPDSDGIEILSILISILETQAARADADTPQETYVWPYFARLPVKSLTPVQKVDLFRVVTGSDYKQMLERGRYVFYQVGIGPDGTWRYFLASE
jgi:hypothetical protein